MKYIDEILKQIKQPLWESWYIKEKIGSGTFSSVYRVEAKRTNRTDESALKIEAITTDGQIFMDVARKKSFLEKQRSHFESETSIMYKLKGCPNVVAYEDEIVKELYINGVFEGYYCLIRMELLCSVYDLMRQGKFDASERNVIRLAKDIGEGIKAAHRIGVIHRDIKPANLFISKEGVYKLGDFNISKITESTRSFAGAQGYIAPEIYRAKADVDASYTRQADIYSFGICLYQMLNDGMLPFEDVLSMDEAMDKRMQGATLPAPKNASSALTKIILKACAFNTENRYQTIDEFLLELSKISEDSGRTVYAGFEQEAVQTTNAKHSVPTEYAGTDSRTSTVQKKRQMWIWFAVAVALVLLGIMGFLLLSKDDNQSNNTSIVDSNTSHEQTSESESQSVEVKTESTCQETQSTITATQNETEPITTEEIKKTEFKLSEIDFLNSSQENSCFVEVSNQRDNVGNIYDYAIVQTDYADSYYIMSDYTQYYVNKRYATFSGTLFLLEEKKTCKSEFDVTISGDGQTLYSTQVSGGFLPEYFNLDISNVDVLEIKIHNGGIANGVDTWIGIGNAVLRTSDHIEAIQSTISEDSTASTVFHSSVKISEIGFMNSSQENGCFIEVSNQKDNVGNIYDYAIIQTDFADRYYITSDYNQYYVNKQYTIFSGTLFLLEEKKTCANQFEVTISGDGQILYSAEVSGGFLPECFELDISNIDVLEIKVHSGGIANGVDTWIGIGNALLFTE